MKYNGKKNGGKSNGKGGGKAGQFVKNPIVALPVRCEPLPKGKKGTLPGS